MFEINLSKILHSFNIIIFELGRDIPYPFYAWNIYIYQMSNY